jgi:hypothetical protein
MISIEEFIKKSECHIDYEYLLESCDIYTLETIRLGEAHGDILFLVEDRKGKYGFVSTGYGSCSGCDVLTASVSFMSQDGGKELDKLRQRVCSRIIWKDAGEMIEYLRNKEWWQEYYFSSIEKNKEEFETFVNNCVEHLAIVYIAKL